MVQAAPIWDAIQREVREKEVTPRPMKTRQGAPCSAVWVQVYVLAAAQSPWFLHCPMVQGGLYSGPEQGRRPSTAWCRRYRANMPTQALTLAGSEIQDKHTCDRGGQPPSSGVPWLPCRVLRVRRHWE